MDTGLFSVPTGPVVGVTMVSSSSEPDVCSIVIVCFEFRPVVRETRSCPKWLPNFLI